MLTHEEQAIIDRLKETARKIDADFESGRITKEEYWAKLKLIDEAEEKMRSTT